MAAQEVMTPTSRFTAFPGVVYALRASDYMGPARGSLTTGSDATSPNGEYVSDTQVVAASLSTVFNTYTGTANGADLASDTLVIDLTEFGLNPSLYYSVLVLYKIIGDNPIASNYYERYAWRYSAQISASVDGTYIIFANRNALANNYSKWLYTYYDDFPNKFALGGDNILRIRAYSLITSGLDVRIGQVVLIPNSQFTGTVWSDSDFMRGNNLVVNQGTRPSLFAGDDVRADDLGSLTVAWGSGPIPGIQAPVREYQTLTDPTEAEWCVKNLSIAPSNFAASTHSYILWGSHAVEAQDVENIVWDDVIPWPGYTRNGFYSPPGANFYDPTTPVYLMLGTTPYGRRVEVRVKSFGLSFAAPGHSFWGFGGYFSPFVAAPAKVEGDGSGIILTVGGRDTNITGLEINIGDDSQRVLAGDATAPFLPDMWDYEIESSVSWDRNLTNASDVAEIGRHGSQHFMAGTYQNTYWSMGNSLVINQRADGSLWGRIRRKLKTDEFLPAVESSTTEIMFDSGYSPGTKIRMKFRRRGYVLEGKIWYDGSTEPSTWTHSDHTVGHYVITASPFAQAAAYPYNLYDRNVSGNHLLVDGWDRSQDGSFDFASDGQGAFFSRSEVPPSGAVDTFGPETTLTSFKWYDFRLSQPDPGDTTAAPHMMLKKTSDNTVYVPDITGSPDRQMLHYLTSTPMRDAKLFAWTEAGSGILNSVAFGQLFAMNVHDDFREVSFHRLFSPPGAYA